MSERQHWNPEHYRNRAGFVGELGGSGNVSLIRSALGEALHGRGIDADTLGPWYFPSARTYRSLLEDGGFEVGYIERFPRPTALPGELAEWLELFAQPFLDAVPESDRDAVIAEVCGAVRPRLRRPDGVWIADYVRLRFAATKPFRSSRGRPR